MCEEMEWRPRTYLVARVLLFLQRGADQKLALSTVKGQISALAVFSNDPWCLTRCYALLCMRSACSSSGVSTSVGSEPGAVGASETAV